MENKLSNPTPLGLLGLGMATALLGFSFAGVVELSAMTLAMVIFYGGLAEIVAGIMEYRRNNTFGATSFISYGLFWFSFAYITISKDGQMFGSAPTGNATAVYMLLWALFTFFMWLGTFGKNKIMQFVYLTLFALFLLQGLNSIVGSEVFGKLSGWMGIISGLSAIYLAMAKILNETRDREILPAGENA